MRHGEAAANDNAADGMPGQADARIPAVQVEVVSAFAVGMDECALAAARRTLRSGPPLAPVRTLHYFLPAIEEVLELPPDPGYVDYLAAKLMPFASKKSALLGER